MHTILVRVAFSGMTKRSQNSRINCILPVISIPPSLSPDTKITKKERPHKLREHKAGQLARKIEKKKKRKVIRDNLEQIQVQQLEIQSPVMKTCWSENKGTLGVMYTSYL